MKRQLNLIEDEQQAKNERFYANIAIVSIVIGLFFFWMWNVRIK